MPDLDRVTEGAEKSYDQSRRHSELDYLKWVFSPALANFPNEKKGISQLTELFSGNCLSGENWNLPPDRACESGIRKFFGALNVGD